MAMRDVFSKIHEENKWGSGHSISGPGSAVYRTQAIRDALPEVIAEYGVKVLMDAPCGDYNWMPSPEDLGVERYIGVDVVEAIIEENRAQERPGVVQFLAADLTSDPLPRADMILCRDCLVHFAEDDLFRALQAFHQSGSEYLLTTTFHSLTENPRGSTGGWRPINLQIEPFNFPEPLAMIAETEYDPEKRYSDKSLGLWRIADLPGA